MPTQFAKILLPWLAIIAAFILAIGGIFAANELLYREHQENFSLVPAPAIGELRPLAVRLQVEFGNGAKRAFRGPAAGMTVLAALRASAEVGGFPVATDERGNIVAVGNIKNSATRRWVFHLNGERAQDRAGHIELKAGDRIIFRYE